MMSPAVTRPPTSARASTATRSQRNSVSGSTRTEMVSPNCSSQYPSAPVFSTAPAPTVSPGSTSIHVPSRDTWTPPETYTTMPSAGDGAASGRERSDLRGAAAREEGRRDDGERGDEEGRVLMSEL